MKLPIIIQEGDSVEFQVETASDKPVGIIIHHEDYANLLRITSVYNGHEIDHVVLELEKTNG